MAKKATGTKKAVKKAAAKKGGTKKSARKATKKEVVLQIPIKGVLKQADSTLKVITKVLDKYAIDGEELAMLLRDKELLTDVVTKLKIVGYGCPQGQAFMIKSPKPKGASRK